VGVRKRPTAKDVGALANVSTATVSRVLSGDRPVSSDMRERVEAAARELGYVPNHFGSALRRRESATVGVLVPRITNPFYPLVLEELEAAAQDIEFHVLIAVSSYDVATERQRLREFVARNVDACVVVPASWARSGEAIRTTHAVVPVIQFDGQSEGAQVPHIGMDNTQAVSALVEHLLDAGRTSLVFVGGGLATSPDIERRQAFLEIAGRWRHRADFAELPGDDYSFETGRRAADELVRGSLRPDAVIGSNDMIALGCIEELERLGVHVPDDIAVCGIDDIGFSGLFRPTLTTVRQPLAEMSRVALSQLRLDADGDTPTPGSTRFPGALVVRMSSATT
jgi:LacI family transcriptional regulator